MMMQYHIIFTSRTHRYLRRTRLTDKQPHTVALHIPQRILPARTEGACCRVVARLCTDKIQQCCIVSNDADGCNGRARRKLENRRLENRIARNIVARVGFQLEHCACVCAREGVSTKCDNAGGRALRKRVAGNKRIYAIGFSRPRHNRHIRACQHRRNNARRRECTRAIDDVAERFRSPVHRCNGGKRWRLRNACRCRCAFAVP